MTFRELYDVELNKPKPPTASQLFRARVAAAARVDENTVKKWLCGTQMPKGATLAAVSQFLGVEPDELFPEAYQTPNTDKQ